MATRRKPQMVYQHEPLVTPEKWSGDERQFSVRLTEILDDLYAKYGQLRQAQAAPPSGGGCYEGELPIASKKQAGIMQVGDSLKATTAGVVSVDAARAVDSADTRPITSQAVYDEMSGMVELLKNI